MTRVQNALIAMTLMVLGSAMFLATSGLISTQAQRGNRAWSNNAADESPPKWEDFADDEIKQKDRLKDRPGNFDALEAVSYFFTGLTDVQPTLVGAAYPCIFARHEIANEGEAEVALRDLGRSSQKNGVFRNSVRLRNLIITRIDFLELKTGLKDAIATDAFKINENEAYALSRGLGAHHKEPALLVRVYLRTEMLNSDKIDNSDVEGCMMALVRKAEGWRVVYFSN